MASVDDILSSLQSALDEINDALNDVSAAASKADELQGQMAAAGVQDKVNQLAAVKDAVEKFSTHLGAGADLGNEAINVTKAVEGT